MVYAAIAGTYVLWNHYGGTDFLHCQDVNCQAP